MECNPKKRPNTCASVLGRMLRNSKRDQSSKGAHPFGNKNLRILLWISNINPVTFLYFSSWKHLISWTSFKTRRCVDNFPAKAVRRNSSSPLFSRGHLPFQKYLNRVKNWIELHKVFDFVLADFILFLGGVTKWLSKLFWSNPSVKYYPSFIQVSQFTTWESISPSLSLECYQNYPYRHLKHMSNKKI